MHLPEQLSIRVLGDGRPLQGMFAVVEVDMRVKNNFYFLFGPSDSEGRIQVSREQLLQEEKKALSFALMDYRGLEGWATGRVFVRTLNRDGIDAALKAYDKFSPSYRYPDDYRTNLEATSRLLAEDPPRLLRVEVTSEGGDMTIGTEQCVP